MHSCCTNEEANKIVVDESSVSIYDLPDPFNVKVYQPIFVTNNMLVVITWYMKRK